MWAVHAVVGSVCMYVLHAWNSFAVCSMANASLTHEGKLDCWQSFVNVNCVAEGWQTMTED